MVYDGLNKVIQTYLFTYSLTYLLTRVQDVSSSQVVDQNDSLFTWKRLVTVKFCWEIKEAASTSSVDVSITYSQNLLTFNILRYV